MKNTLRRNAIWNAEKEFWDGDHTRDVINRREYFKKDRWPKDLLKVADQGLVMSALGGLLNYLTTVCPRWTILWRLM